MKSGLLAFGALICGSLAARAARAGSARAAARRRRRRQSDAPSRSRRVRTVGSAACATQPAHAVQQPAGSAIAPRRPMPVAVPKDWRGVFDAIDAGNWASAQAGIAALPPSILTPVAKAELYTAKGRRPSTSIPSRRCLPRRPSFRRRASSRRWRSSAARDAAADHSGKADRQSRLRAGPLPRPAGSGRALGRPAPRRARSADQGQRRRRRRSAAAHLRAASVRRSARRSRRSASPSSITSLASTWMRAASPTPGAQGATGEWAAQSAWVSGLASWRLGDFKAASAAFQQVAALAAAARASRRRLLLGCARRAGGRPPALGRAAAQGAQAAESPESFYGLLARETLGMEPSCRPTRSSAAIRRSTSCPTCSARWSWRGSASPALAEEMLRHQAKIGAPAEHHALIQLAKRLDLPAAQLWLAKNGQPGARSDAADRYPNPRWSPVNGWRVDPALAFGHIVQESSFRRTAVSPAGAVGLMQVLPITAQQMSRERAAFPTRRATLTDPRYNLEFGQSFIEKMRGSLGDRRPAAARDRVLQCRPAAGRPLGDDQRQGRSAAVDRVHPLLGDALLRARGAAEHVGLPGPQPRGHADA